MKMLRVSFRSHASKKKNKTTNQQIPLLLFFFKHLLCSVFFFHNAVILRRSVYVNVKLVILKGMAFRKEANITRFMIKS